MNQVAPTVSIITPLFNSIEYFGDTANSILGQTFTDFEWIIVDGGSTDGSYEMAEQLAKSDDRIILVKQKNSSGGIGAARKEALDIANGHYVSFLDADDMYDSDFLEKQLAFIKDHGPFVCSSYRRVSANGSKDFIVPAKMTHNSILKGNPIGTLTAMFDRTVYPDARFPENSQMEDLAFWLLLLRKEGVVCYGNQEVLATYRIHSGSASSKNLRKVKYMWNIYKREKINFFKRFYYLFRYAFGGVIKHSGENRG